MLLFDSGIRLESRQKAASGTETNVTIRTLKYMYTVNAYMDEGGSVWLSR
jgi:hypothetical protein